MPFLLYPEGAVHNCDVALMRYEKFAFSLGVPVVPIALRVSHPFPITHFVATASPEVGRPPATPAARASLLLCGAF